MSQKSPEAYAEFIENMASATVKTADDFERWAGYRPSAKQTLLLLARSRRENWAGYYIKVIRDKRGRLVTWKRIGKWLGWRWRQK